MMIKIKQYNEIPVDLGEILRYMNAENNAETVSIIEECLKELHSKLSYKVCYDQFAITLNGNLVDLGFTTIESDNLSNNLKDCQSVIIFAATIGIEIDRLIARYGRLSPVKALAFQAIGAERIESLCNEFNREMTLEQSGLGFYTRARFSPGYGDLELSYQKDIFRVLDCSRKIGLSLNDSLLMSPSKSVTAIIGVSNIEKNCTKKGCSSCEKRDCSFRRND
ncbi:MAG: vitamin B12 dependent-methionine synthase activation domain-containing protein [Firmicutes bacterium]|nr:vitamin B12 dependent-methionine synthase activation domain-containing protein [Bacillota bacterium]